MLRSSGMFGLSDSCILNFQAAKEFETELKKEPEDGSKPSPAEGPKAVGSEDEKKELETSATKENA